MCRWLPALCPSLHSSWGSRQRKAHMDAGTIHPSLLPPSLPLPFLLYPAHSAFWDSVQWLGGLCAKSLSYVQLFEILWTVARHTPLSMGILQAIVLDWVAMPSSRASSQPRKRTGVSCTAGRFLTSWAAREAWAGGYQALKAKNGLTLQECVRPNGKSSRSWSSQVPQASFPVQQVVRFWGGWRWQPEAILQD